MRRIWLLDVNLLIAMTHAAHLHHREAHAWFGAVPQRGFATCALTQLSFIRLSCNPKVVGSVIAPPQAMSMLAKLGAHPGHAYWADAPEPLGIAMFASPALVGHRQVTDVYLLALAVQRDQVLATLDRGLVSLAGTLGLDRHVELVMAAPVVQDGPPRGRAG